MKGMHSRYYAPAVLFVFFMSLTACSRQESPPVDMKEKAETEYYSQVPESPLRIVVGAMLTPKRGLIYYRELVQYIGQKLGRQAVSIDRVDYEEVDDLLRENKVEVGFVCSGPYVRAHDGYGLRILVVPQVAGKTTYNSYIIVHRDSDAREMKDLQGKSFAFADPLSNTGCLVPTYMLAKKGRTPETFFSSTIYSHAHDRSIQAVAEGVVDGAAVDSLVYESMKVDYPEVTGSTRVIEISPPFGIPPVVVPPGLDPEVTGRLRDVFLNMHRDPEGADILKKMRIDRFVQGRDEEYASVRAMEEWLAEKGISVQE